MSSQVWTCHDISINLVQRYLTFYWVFFFSPQVCLIIPLNFQSTWFIKEKKGNHYSSRLMLFSRLPVKDQHIIALPLCCFKYQLRFFVKLCQIFIPLEILTSASIGLTAIWICRLCVLYVLPLSWKNHNHWHQSGVADYVSYVSFPCLWKITSFSVRKITSVSL